MSLEQYVREKHLFEDRVNDFLEQVNAYISQAAFLSVRALEIGIAKILDSLETIPKADESRLDRMFKARLLKYALDQQKSGKKLSLLSRLKGVSPDFFDAEDSLKPFFAYKFFYPLPFSENIVSTWPVGDAASERLLLLEHNK